MSIMVRFEKPKQKQREKISAQRNENKITYRKYHQGSQSRDTFINAHICKRSRSLA